jgi:RNA polymerase sigma factor for flagellar operon FliA
MNVDERDARIRELLPLVKHIARRIRRLARVDVDDLIGDGCIGLIRAVDRFDPTRGTTLEHYARRLIAGAMLNGIRRMDPVSERTRRAVRDIENRRYHIALERGEVPSSPEMERLCPGFERVRFAAYARVPLSLDAPLPEGESLPADWSGDPAEIVDERFEGDRIRASIGRLPPRQRALVHEHYYGDRSLREICKSMRISPQRASQIHVVAMTALRKALNAPPR